MMRIQVAALAGLALLSVSACTTTRDGGSVCADLGFTKTCLNSPITADGSPNPRYNNPGYAQRLGEVESLGWVAYMPNGDLGRPVTEEYVLSGKRCWTLETVSDRRSSGIFGGVYPSQEVVACSTPSTRPTVVNGRVIRATRTLRLENGPNKGAIVPVIPERSLNFPMGFLGEDAGQRLGSLLDWKSGGALELASSMIVGSQVVTMVLPAAPVAVNQNEKFALAAVAVSGSFGSPVLQDPPRPEHGGSSTAATALKLAA